NTTLIGSNGDDEIYGYGGDDKLDGGKGNDILYGGYGNDTYIFKKGYGNDVINEDNKGSTADRVVFGEGITANDLNISRDGDDLVLSIKGTDDSLRIVNQYLYNDYRVEKFIFANGKTYSAKNIFDISLTIKGEGEIKDFDGGYGTRNTTLIGGDDADVIYGYGGDDTLDGGKGDDTLYGGYGDDTYIFKKGYGNDVIDEDNKGSGSDKVVFGSGITAKDIKVSRDGNDLVLSIRGTNDSLRIVNQYMYKDYRVESFELADGTAVTAEDIFNMSLTIKGEGVIKDYDGGYGTRNTTLIGGDGADEIYGYGGDDTLDSGKGNDTLYGGYGDDTYIFKKGYGSDVINEDNKGSGADKVVFGEGITLNDIEATIDGNDLILSINGTEDTLRIVNHRAYRDYRIESFEFADGTVAEFDFSNNSFNILVSGSDFDEIVSEQTVILDEIYDDSTTTDELTTNEADILVSELSAANVGNENNSLSDMTDIQAMILAENMSAFGGGNNVYDSVNNNTEDNSSLGDLFTAAQI
ncbi:calcium-binding protein, partial [uncultured Ruminococcus sp.]|uniref:calcium-binding protein n=1 Tax=uncultured Ruminococcus sp. TaxID=165186 RepID=UPI0025F51754